MGSLGASLPAEIIAEVVQRTPGFSGWQQQHWPTHCGDACAFIGCAGYDDILGYGSPSLVDSLRSDMEMSADEFQDYLASLNAKTGPTAYVFRCLHCGVLLGYSDFA